MSEFTPQRLSVDENSPIQRVPFENVIPIFNKNQTVVDILDAVRTDEKTGEIICNPKTMLENIIYPIFYKDEKFAVQKNKNEIHIFEFSEI